MKQLHIVCLDVPYPTNYGGASEMFHKIRALHAAGVLIHLHVFEYGRGVQPILESHCASVYYYRRMEGHKGLSMKLPYIVASRANPNCLRDSLKTIIPFSSKGSTPLSIYMPACSRDANVLFACTTLNMSTTGCYPEVPVLR